MFAVSVLLAIADLFIGTQGLGNVTPAAAWPFGLVQPGPDTSAVRTKFLPNKGHCGGYQHNDRWIWRFSQTHISGTGCAAFGDFGLMPFAGNWDCEKSAFAMDKSQERAEPGYYAVGVENGLGITRCEMTALEHTAVYRFTFGKPAKGVKLLMDLDWGMSYRDVTNSWRGIVRDCRFERRGETFLGGHYAWCWNDYRYHFVLKTSAPVTCVRTMRKPGSDRGGIYVMEFSDIQEGSLIVRIALSNTSPEEAEKNLLAESPTADFEAARSRSASAWAARLGLVELDATTDPKVRTAFETAMYRLFFQPNRQSDVGKRPVYSTFSLWDTFRAAHPLYTILAPSENRDFVLSMLDQYDRQGYLPIWALGGSENHCMIGHHSVPVIVDACLKGLLKSDEAERAFRAIKDSLTCNHRAINKGTWGLTKEDWDILDEYGYYPFDMMRGEFEGRKVLGESVARVYECAYDDACAARLADALGRREDAAFFKKRSENWRNVFDTSIGYARGKDSQGRWREPFNRYDCGKGPWFDNDFCGGGSCQYTWHVMHDPEGLVAALGGKVKAGERLDLLFNDKAPDKNDRGFNYDIAGCIGQYVHGNEPSHHIAYLYAYTDRPENVGPIIRKVFDTKYGTTPDGLCGNDDCGQMSAWYVFSALGFYPMDPCGGNYVLGAPQVPAATVRLPNGKLFKIVAQGLSASHARVKSVVLNGKTCKERILRHADLLAGGELVFEME